MKRESERVREENEKERERESISTDEFDKDQIPALNDPETSTVPFGTLKCPKESDWGWPPSNMFRMRLGAAITKTA